jgi:hypothetical protein
MACLDMVEKTSLDMVEKVSLDMSREDEPRHGREGEPRHGREDEPRHGREGEPRHGREDEREKFLNSRQNRTRRLVCPRRLGAFNAPIPFLETLPRVGLGLVVCAANNCRSSRRASCREVEAFPAVNRGTSLHCPPLRRVDASSSPLPYKCRALVHSSPIFIP